MFRQLLAELDDKASQVIEAIDTEDDDSLDLQEIIESLKETITDYQQTKGWI